MRVSVPLLSLALASASIAGSAAAGPASTNLLVIDQDAEQVNLRSAGALYNVDVAAAPGSAPAIEAAATAGAPFELISGVAISPVDGRAYVADVGIDDPVTGAPAVPRILAIDGVSGAAEVIAEGAPMAEPFALAFAPDGRLFIVDPEADPSGLGSSLGCGNYGAVFVIDTTRCTAPCTPALLSDGTSNDTPPAVSAFGNPLGIAYDPVTDSIYVVDSCASPVNLLGSVFRVDPTTGRVTFVSSTLDYLNLISIDVRADGTPLVVDQGDISGDSVVWIVDLAAADKTANTTALTGGTQYSQIQDVAVDASDRVYLVDWGEFNTTTNTFDILPAIWRVDESIADPDTNGVLVNQSTDLLTPVGIAVVPVPVATRLTPSTISAPTNVLIEGSNLYPGVTLDFGPNVAVSSVTDAAGRAPGTAIQVLVTPTILPTTCRDPHDLTLDHPFGGRSTLASALVVEGAIARVPPRSDRGDANADGIVDGLDLAILGMHFGADICDGPAFVNDADFTDNDIIDGQDLAVLAAYFGVRF